MNETVSLFFQHGGSDKVYHLQLQEVDGGWMVFYKNGPRLGTLTQGKKTQEPVAYDKAKKVYDKVIKEKTSKGYVATEGASPFSGGMQHRQFMGYRTQLLNPASTGQESELITDDTWVLQEKHDGHRRLVIVDKHKPAMGTNREGLQADLPDSVAKVFEALDVPARLVVDAELMGEVLAVFDVIEFNGVDLRPLPYKERLAKMHELALVLESVNAQNVFITRTAFGQMDKRRFFETLRRSKLEGGVWKRIDAPYTEGRPSSGGTQLKSKFIQSASCLVTSKNKSKRSIALHLLDEQGQPVQVGNCTIGTNHDIPEAGAVVEIQYLYAFKGGSLFQPQYKGVRDDISPKACLLSQLLFKGSSDLEERHGQGLAASEAPYTSKTSFEANEVLKD